MTQPRLTHIRQARGHKRRVLEWLKDKTPLELQVSMSGFTNAAEFLRREGFIERFDDESVKDAHGYPATALRLTDAGKRLFDDPAKAFNRSSGQDPRVTHETSPVVITHPDQHTEETRT